MGGAGVCGCSCCSKLSKRKYYNKVENKEIKCSNACRNAVIEQVPLFYVVMFCQMPSGHEYTQT